MALFGALTGIATGLGALGGFMGASAQESAAQRAMRTQRQTLEQQRALAEQAQGMYAPYYGAGERAIPQLESMSSGDYMYPEQREMYERMAAETTQPIGETPEYQWRLSESEDAINRALAARGMYGSSYGVSQLADQQRALGSEMSANRYSRLGGLYDVLGAAEQQKYSRLADLANLGYGSATGQANVLGQLGTNIGQYGQGMSGLQQGLGTAQASMYGTMGALPMTGLGTYTQYMESQRPRHGMPSPNYNALSGVM